MTRKQQEQILLTNKKALFDYEILEQFEAGIVLLGAEVKSLKQGKANLNGAYVVLKNNEAFLLNATISPYQPQNMSQSYDPLRTRKLLLRRSELNYLYSKNKERGLTLIPLKVYNKNGLIKIQIALVRGKKKFDKRETIKRREEERRIKEAY
ncbi:MAG: SsrA-binding protein SmpB [Parcubacteria group bacterium]|nr:SsrA-binding protein SmpB [Parcubacteria group bacterium]